MRALSFLVHYFLCTIFLEDCSKAFWQVVWTYFQGVVILGVLIVSLSVKKVSPLWLIKSRMSLTSVWFVEIIQLMVSW